MLTIAVLITALAADAGAAPGTLSAPQPLWPRGAPGALGTTDGDIPAVAIALPDPAKAVGAAVVICPGGGYAVHAMVHEGSDVARWFTDRGVAAFVLRYRLGHRYRHPAPLQDVQRAVRFVRSGAARYGVRPDRIGVLGFSAGGHLASTAATLFDEGNPRSADPIDRASARPDFAVLAYPVIFMDGEGTHRGSRQRLLGDAPDPALLERLSTHRQVTARTPPTFLFHTSEDSGVPPENSVAFYAALRRAGVPAELHIYERGKHGVGLAPADPVLSSWPQRLEQWLRVRGVLPTPR